MERIVISSARGCFVELIHRDSDPSSWIVRRWTKFLWFKKPISSHWFNDERQALEFAGDIKREYQRH